MRYYVTKVDTEVTFYISPNNIPPKGDYVIQICRNNPELPLSFGEQWKKIWNKHLVMMKSSKTTTEFNIAVDNLERELLITGAIIQL